MANALAEYLFRKRLSRKEFAAKAGMSAATVCNICNDAYSCSKMIAEKIELATEGEIQAHDLLDKSNQGFGDMSDTKKARKRRERQEQAIAVNEQAQLQATVQHRPDNRSIVVTISLV